MKRLEVQCAGHVLCGGPARYSVGRLVVQDTYFKPVPSHGVLFLFVLLHFFQEVREMVKGIVEGGPQIGAEDAASLEDLLSSLDDFNASLVRIHAAYDSVVPSRLHTLFWSRQPLARCARVAPALCYHCPNEHLAECAYLAALVACEAVEPVVGEVAAVPVVAMIALVAVVALVVVVATIALPLIYHCAYSGLLPVFLLICVRLSFSLRLGLSLSHSHGVRGGHGGGRGEARGTEGWGCR